MYTVIYTYDKLNKKLFSNINWEKCGFKSLGCGATLSESIKLSDNFNADVLISDFTDETEKVLNDAVKKRSFSIIFFTEKKKLLAAKNAASLNVLEYVIRPCTKAHFEDILFQVKEKLDKKYSESETPQESLFKRLPDNIKAAIESFRLNLNKEDFIVINIQNKKPEQFKTVPVFFDTIKNIFGKYLNGECIVFNDIVTIIISDMAVKIKKNMNPMLISIIQNLEKFKNIKYVIGISNSFSSIDKIFKAYFEAKDALLYSFETKNEITLFSDIKQEELKPDFLKNFKSGLEEKIKFETIKDVQNYVETAFNELKRNKNSKASLYMFLLEIISVCDSLESGSGLKNSFLESIVNNRQLEHIENKIIQKCCEICNNFIIKMQSGVEKIVEQAMTIIEENYKNPDFSLKMLSESLHISVNYLCAIIKKVKGASFVNLLTEVRMKKSKDLLICTNSRIQEVAYEVGFVDQHYFSYCFKRHFKITPKEMREKGKKENYEAAKSVFK